MGGHFIKAKKERAAGEVSAKYEKNGLDVGKHKCLGRLSRLRL